MIKVELHVGQGMPELKPVETEPLPPQTTGVASLVIEAGTIRGENRCSPLEAHEFSRGRMSHLLWEPAESHRNPTREKSLLQSPSDSSRREATERHREEIEENRGVWGPEP